MYKLDPIFNPKRPLQRKGENANVPFSGQNGEAQCTHKNRKRKVKTTLFEKGKFMNL